VKFLELTRAIPERFCGGDSLRRGAISSLWAFTFFQDGGGVNNLLYA